LETDFGKVKRLYLSSPAEINYPAVEPIAFNDWGLCFGENSAPVQGGASGKRLPGSNPIFCVEVAAA
jgi:hypothetical protein